MSLKITVQVTDQITPALRQLQAKTSNLTPAMRSIGVALVAIAKRAFDEPDLRPAPWAAKKDGSVATLKRKGLLWRSVRVVNATPSGVTIGSDRAYAAIHQLGKPFPWRRGQSKGKAYPARPFFPFRADGTLTDRAATEISRVIAIHLNIGRR